MYKVTYIFKLVQLRSSVSILLHVNLNCFSNSYFAYINIILNIYFFNRKREKNIPAYSNSSYLVTSICCWEPATYNSLIVFTFWH